jgi:hypothetical protein
MMELVALGLGAVFAAATVVFVALPFVRDPAAASTARPAADDRRRLLEHRSRALAALKELEFDHRTGKISDADYRRLLPALRQEAAAVLRRLEPPQEPARAPVRRRRRKRAAAGTGLRRAG